MQPIAKISGVGALLYCAALLGMGSAEAFPLNAGNSSVRAMGDVPAHTLFIQAQCGPGGCPPSGARPPGARQPGYVGDSRSQSGINRDLMDLGINLGTAIITDQMMRQQRPANSDYAENYCGKRGMVPQFSPSGKFKCVVVSDARLKRDIIAVGRLDRGFGIYRYRYLWSDTEYVGVLAQEVAKSRPDVVVQGADGYLRVDYDRLGMRMMTWNDWMAAH